MKVFISMPMNSKSEDEIKEAIQREFQAIKKELPDAELIDSVFDMNKRENEPTSEPSWLIKHLWRAIQLMAEADLVFFIGDWKNARGCYIEHMIAKSYGKFCIEIE